MLSTTEVSVQAAQETKSKLSVLSQCPVLLPKSQLGLQLQLRVHKMLAYHQTQECKLKLHKDSYYLNADFVLQVDRLCSSKHVTANRKRQLFPHQGSRLQHVPKACRVFRTLNPTRRKTTAIHCSADHTKSLVPREAAKLEHASFRPTHQHPELKCWRPVPFKEEKLFGPFSLEIWYHTRNLKTEITGNYYESLPKPGIIHS